MRVATATMIFNTVLPRLAQTPAVRNAIAALYKVTDAIPGGTAAAVANEALTGMPTKGVTHALSKLPQSIARLENILSRPDLPAWDRALSEWMLRQLQNVRQP